MRASEVVGEGRDAEQGRDAELRQGLRRMRTTATSLLVFVAVVYVVTWRWIASGAPGWVGYVNSAAEAGVVGALADWFAVTALFRHPLGLPIPHTAIIPKRKDALGRGLEGFVATHFLASDVVRGKVRDLHPADRLGAWLRQPVNAERVTDQVSTRLVGAVSGLSDDFVQEIVEKTVLPRLVERQWAPVVGAAVRRVAEDGLHHRLVDLLAAEAHYWLEHNADTVHRVVLDQAPSWSPRFVDEAIAARVYFEAVRFVADLRADQQHRVRRALDSFLLSFADRLHDDPALADQVENLKRRVVEHPEAHRVVTAMWSTTKAVLLDFASDPTSVPRKRVTEEIAAFGSRLCTEIALQETFDRASADVATRLVNRYRDEIATIIGDTVARWQPDETSAKIELQVGRDLQFIRINGTVVGALAGLLIHLVTELAL
jgi:uncharacterized membrane-anchored protein YjiN (DUF445 family)